MPWYSPFEAIGNVLADVVDAAVIQPVEGIAAGAAAAGCVVAAGACAAVGQSDAANNCMNEASKQGQTFVDKAPIVSDVKDVAEGIAEGNPGKALMGVGCLAMNVVPGGGAVTGQAVKGVAKGVAKNIVKNTAKAALKKGGKDFGKNVVKKGFKGAAKKAAKKAVKAGKHQFKKAIKPAALKKSMKKQIKKQYKKKKKEMKKEFKENLKGDVKKAFEEYMLNEILEVLCGNLAASKPCTFIFGNCSLIDAYQVEDDVRRIVVEFDGDINTNQQHQKICSQIQTMLSESGIGSENCSVRKLDHVFDGETTFINLQIECGSIDENMMDDDSDSD